MDKIYSSVVITGTHGYYWMFPSMFRGSSRLSLASSVVPSLEHIHSRIFLLSTFFCFSSGNYRQNNVPQCYYYCWLLRSAIRTAHTPQPRELRHQILCCVGFVRHRRPHSMDTSARLGGSKFPVHRRFSTSIWQAWSCRPPIVLSTSSR